MTAWAHLTTNFKRRFVLLLAGLIVLCVALTTTLFFAMRADAVAGINQTLSFQGRLSRASGGVVPDGFYNIQFKVYQDGAGTSAGNSGGTLKWTETYINNGGTAGVQVKNGLFSVNLGSQNAFGSSVDWNQDTIWLSMNVAGSATSCTTFGTAPCAADGEMLPMKRMTATPFSLNSALLEGMSASDFIQNSNFPQTANLNITGTGVFGTSVQSSVLDTATSTSLSIGSTNATSINLSQNSLLASGKTLTISGGNTASRPASPTEGMVYYDTTSKQLITYSNGKWQSDRATATKIVAASNSNQSAKDGADYVATGSNDQTIINSALTAAAGGNVYLTEGTYTTSDAISIPNNTTLMGSGRGTVIQFANISGQSKNMITNTDQTTGEGVSVRDLRLEGNNTANTSGTQHGIYLKAVGAGVSGGAMRQGATVINTWVNNFRSTGILYDGSSNGTVANNNVFGNIGDGISIKASNRDTVSNNTVLSNSAFGIHVSGALAITVNANTISGNGLLAGTNTGGGILFDGTSTNNAITNNALRDNAVSSGSANSSIFISTASNNSITGNSIFDSSGSGYGINIFDSASTSNYIADNTLVGTGSINTQDNGTSTVIAGQLNSSGNYVIQPAGSIELTKNVQIGNGIADADKTVLTLDKATSAPTAALGSMYYDTTLGKVQCYESAGWGDCGDKPDTFINISPEYTNAVMNGAGIGTISSDLCSDTLNINDGSSGQPTICNTNETRNFYKWTSAQGTDQTRSIYLSYQLPTNFKQFVSGTTSLMGRTDSTNSTVSYQVYKDHGTSSALASCGSAVTVSNGVKTAWQTVAASGSADPTNCTFVAGDTILVRINLVAKSNANAYVSNIAFVFSNN